MCQDIFKALSQNPDCIELLHNRLVPTLVSMMSVNHADKSKDGKLLYIYIYILLFSSIIKFHFLIPILLKYIVHIFFYKIIEKM